jgi:hypothetical protein
MHLAQQRHGAHRIVQDFSKNPLLVYWEMTQV